MVLWKRKWLILGSHEAHFLVHSRATDQKIAEVRFQEQTFAAQMANSKQALSLATFLIRFQAGRILFHELFYISIISIPFLLQLLLVGMVIGQRQVYIR